MSSVWSRIKNWLIAMGSPPHFYKWATRSLPWLAGLAVIVFCVGLTWGIGFSPTDYKQGDVYRIIYIHVPSAILAESIYIFMAISGFISMVWRAKIAGMLINSAAPIGAGFTLVALLTGSTVISENLGDDLDLIDLDHLGTCERVVSSFKDTVIQISDDMALQVKDVISSLKEDVLKETNPNRIVKLEKRLAMLSAKVAIVQVGGNSDIELKEKTDRVEDAICATKAAIKEGVVAGGGVALVNAVQNIEANTEAEKLVAGALRAPYEIILNNAGLHPEVIKGANMGIDARSGDVINMALLKKLKLINKNSQKLKILGTGEIKDKVNIEADLISKSAVEKLEKAGGTIQLKK